jgi:hypothetical protein
MTIPLIRTARSVYCFFLSKRDLISFPTVSSWSFFSSFSILLRSFRPAFQSALH